MSAYQAIIRPLQRRSSNKTTMASLLIFAMCWASSSSASTYEQGRACFEKNDYLCAVDIWFPLAKSGNTQAQFSIGQMYWYGQGVERNYQAALAWYEEAADLGDETAQLAMAQAYTDGIALQPSPKKTFYWYKKAAQGGSTEGMRRLGKMYENGLGVSRDLEVALEWYRNSAEQGNANEQLAFGHRYRTGTLVEKDLSQSHYWFGLAAQQDQAEAQYFYALFYYLGLGQETAGAGITKDLKEAEKWLKRSSRNGHLDAKFLYAQMLLKGEGVAVDKGAAVTQLASAANLEHQASAKALAKAVDQLPELASQSEGLSVHEAPDTNAPLIKQLMPNERIYLLNKGQDWHRIYFHESPAFGVFALDLGHRVGYVKADQVSIKP